MTTYFVVIERENGPGFQTVLVRAESPHGAVEIAAEAGYGRGTNGRAFVAKTECVASFTTNDTTRVHVDQAAECFHNVTELASA